MPTNIHFSSFCGHTAVVERPSSSYATRWACKISGPKINDAVGHKCVFSSPSVSAAKKAIATYLKVLPTTLMIIKGEPSQEKMVSPPKSRQRQSTPQWQPSHQNVANTPRKNQKNVSRRLDVIEIDDDYSYNRNSSNDNDKNPRKPPRERQQQQHPPILRIDVDSGHTRSERIEIDISSDEDNADGMKESTNIYNSSSNNNQRNRKSRSSGGTNRQLDKYEISPNSLSYCQKCKRKIIKNKHHRVGFSKYDGRYKKFIFTYYHKSCCTMSQLSKLNLEQQQQQQFPSKQRPQSSNESTDILNKISQSTISGKIFTKLNNELKRQQDHEKKKRRIVDVDRCVLRNQLQDIRLAFARRLGRPCFMIFDDKTLDDIVLKLPMTQSQLLNCYGMGDKRYRNFGSSILQVTVHFIALNNHNSSTIISRKQRRTSKRKPSTTSRNTDNGTRKRHTSDTNGRIDNNANDDDDDLVITEETLTAEQIVDNKFKEAAKNGYMIEVD